VVCAYSVRARERPTVSPPVTCDEVAEAAGSGDATGLAFEMGNVLDRLAADVAAAKHPIASRRTNAQCGELRP
jgi:DNA primase